MKMSKSKIIGFYHQKGLVPTWNLAKKFAGEGGKIATLPDIIEARLNTKPGDIPWTNYFTTNTAEYVGYNKDYKRIIIVAHGVGPMSTLKGILKAYSYEYEDKVERHNRGGRITQKQFNDLEAGKYGKVEVLDYDSVIKQFDCKYPFWETINLQQCCSLDLLRARLGPRAEEYLKVHAQYASEWHKQRGDGEINNPYILRAGNASNCSYQHHQSESGISHLLAIDGLINLCQSPKINSLISEIDCHEWSNGTRFVGIKKDATINKIDQSVNEWDLLKNNWQKLMVPVLNPPLPGGMKRIITLNNQLFTEYPKKGNCQDSGEAEHIVLSHEPIGEPVEFVTKIIGYPGFLSYDLKEITVFAPENSNTYMLPEETEIIQKNGKSYHKTKIQFYRAEICYSTRLMHAIELANNHKILIELTN